MSREGHKITLSKGTAELNFEFGDWSQVEEKLTIEMRSNHRDGEMAGKPLRLEIDPQSRQMELLKEWVAPNKTEVGYSGDEKGQLWEVYKVKQAKRMVIEEIRPKNVQIYLDYDSVEIYVDGGRYTLSIRVPDGDAQHHIDQIQVGPNGWN